MRDLIKEYLDSKKDMQLATVANGKPWICTVYFVYDDDFNLYWTSGRSRQHSLEILKDSNAAVTIVRDTERKQALQISGNAFEVANGDLERVHALYQNRYGKKDYDLDEMKKHDPVVVPTGYSSLMLYRCGMRLITLMHQSKGTR